VPSAARQALRITNPLTQQICLKGSCGDTSLAFAALAWISRMQARRHGVTQRANWCMAILDA
jgi:transglutaminase-like putative cysteine protease